MSDSKELLNALRHLVARAWQTMAQVRDPDAKYLGGPGGWPLPIVHDFNEAYGYSSAKVRRFKPTAEDVSNAELVMTWMAWLRREEGDDTIRRLMAWALGVPTWMIAQRERCSERTVLNRVDRSLGRVLEQFMAADPEIELIEELEAVGDAIRADCGIRPDLNLPDDTTVASVTGIEPGKVFIAGVGFMFRGKPWDNGERKKKKYA